MTRASPDGDPPMSTSTTDTPARPAGHVPLDDFWRRRGYAPVPGLVASLAWKEHDEAGESPKPMQYWLRAL